MLKLFKNCQKHKHETKNEGDIWYRKTWAGRDPDNFVNTILGILPFSNNNQVTKIANLSGPRSNILNFNVFGNYEREKKSARFARVYNNSNSGTQIARFKTITPPLLSQDEAV